MSVLSFIVTVVGSFLCSWIVLRCLWASGDRRADHEEENRNDKN